MTMPTIRHFSLLLASAVLASSCRFNPNPLDVDIAEQPQKLVVSSFVLPPQEMVVTFTRTFSALLGSDSINLRDDNVAKRVFVENGAVSITYRGKSVTLQPLAPGLYGSVDIEQWYNEKYTLRASDARTGQSVQAETVLLEPVPFDQVIPEQVRLLGDTLYSVRYRFTDRPNVENYYLVTYTNLRDLRNSTQTFSKNLFNFQRSQFNVFSDRAEGDGKTINFQPNLSGKAGDTLVVALSNIPKGYYEFLAAYKRSGNLFSQLIGEPINLPSNVVGGYGYFAMILPKVEVVILK